MKFNELASKYEIKDSLILEVSNMEKLAKITGSKAFKTIFGSENKLTKIIDQYKRYDPELFTGVKLMDPNEIKSMEEFNAIEKKNMENFQKHIESGPAGSMTFPQFNATMKNRIAQTIQSVNPTISANLQSEFQTASDELYKYGYSSGLGLFKKEIEGKFKNSGLDFSAYDDLIKRTYDPKYDNKQILDHVFDNMPTLKAGLAYFSNNPTMLAFFNDIKQSLNISQDYGLKTLMQEINKANEMFTGTHKEPGKIASKFSWHFAKAK